jgi:hypothetical protein
MSEPALRRGDIRDEGNDFNRKGEQADHNARLRFAYQEYVRRLPAGFKPVSFEMFAMVVGDGGTLRHDNAWVHRGNE